MLKFGEFSPNNPKMRVATQPYLGLGEYEQRRQLLYEQRKAEYQKYTEKIKHPSEQDNLYIKNNFKGSRPVSNSRSNSRDKSVQTDIKNIHTKLLHYEPSPEKSISEKEKHSHSKSVNIDNVQIQTQNNIIVPGYGKYIDKIAALKDSSPRAKLLADLQSSCFPPATDFQPVPIVTVEDEKIEKIRRQEKYFAELRQQIEEKQRLLQKHKEQERIQQELEAQRLESQIRQLNIDDKQPSLIMDNQKYLSLVPTSKIRDYENKSDQTLSRRKKLIERRQRSRMSSESSITTMTTPLSERIRKRHPSPGLKRSTEHKPPYSFNIPSNSVFSHKNNSKLSLNINSNLPITTTKRVSATVQTNKLDETLPIPVLKAQSPVAKELINALPVQSKPTSDAIRKLEDKWQIPAVQKNIIKNAERQSDGNNHGILTQLGAIRLQLQQEQLRLDETLRKRGTSQNQPDIHNNF